MDEILERLAEFEYMRFEKALVGQVRMKYKDLPENIKETFRNQARNTLQVVYTFLKPTKEALEQYTEQSGLGHAVNCSYAAGGDICDCKAFGIVDLLRTIQLVEKILEPT